MDGYLRSRQHQVQRMEAAEGSRLTLLMTESFYESKVKAIEKWVKSKWVLVCSTVNGVPWLGFRMILILVLWVNINFLGVTAQRKQLPTVPMPEVPESGFSRPSLFKAHQSAIWLGDPAGVRQRSTISHSPKVGRLCSFQDYCQRNQYGMWATSIAISKDWRLTWLWRCSSGSRGGNDCLFKTSGNLHPGRSLYHRIQRIGHRTASGRFTPVATVRRWIHQCLQ